MGLLVGNDEGGEVIGLGVGLPGFILGFGVGFIEGNGVGTCEGSVVGCVDGCRDG